ncbi:ATP-binding cassette domain-containing protein [Falsihalocynthiibacter arcticus]|uniref:Sulfate ABC transporter ATP-binding protein n=1 Tax=Falsihalocynthiibacter arcticus TaxID=1579316 RepID=A0A126UVT4_9RHOB|nr:ATP-binding cassette domain-containing protein [Falsihalocynthiibacter arcticus]AML50160.1 sulfate ABC transporter ATP-binding protein [Falsihalocynthiibacter arcticus]
MVTSILPLNLNEAVVSRKGKRLIGPVTHEVSGHGITIVLGPNGAGKTTFLRLMHGVERVSQGSVNWAQPVEIAENSQSFVFQSPIMLRRSVEQNLMYPLDLCKTPKPEAKERAREWASRIGLLAKLDQQAPRLSGGEKQKLALARALIRRPEVLFLDEPCASLDGHATREIEKILLDTAASGTRILMATHDLGQSRRLATDVVFMLSGRIHETGPAAQFYATPKHTETKMFLNGDIVE